MKLFDAQRFETMDDLLTEQMQDLYDAEKRLVDALPKMAEAAKNPDLSAAFLSHLEETKGQVARLDDAFRLMGQEPKREACDAMKGLISEGEEMISAQGNPDVRDAALIAAAQRVEHYEMAGYGSARNFAERCGRADVAELLEITLQEEKAADSKLTSLAEGSINPKAAATKA